MALIQLNRNVEVRFHPKGGELVVLRHGDDLSILPKARQEKLLARGRAYVVKPAPRPVKTKYKKPAPDVIPRADTPPAKTEVTGED